MVEVSPTFCRHYELEALVRYIMLFLSAVKSLDSSISTLSAIVTLNAEEYKGLEKDIPKILSSFKFLN